MNNTVKHKKTPHPLYVAAGVVLGILAVLALVGGKIGGYFTQKVHEPTQAAKVIIEQEKHPEYEEPGGTTTIVIIDIKNNAFVPQTVTVKPDVTIAFVNEDDVSHTATADNFGSGEIGNFDTGSLPKNKRVDTVSYGIPGTYPYHDRFNLHIKGAIIVKE